MQDFFNLKNDLYLTTPWKKLSQLSHHHYFYIDSEDDLYRVETQLKLKHNENWIDVSSNKFEKKLNFMHSVTLNLGPEVN